MKLEIYKEPVKRFIFTTLQDAKIEHKAISSIGIYISPINGWLSININKDTPLEQTEFNCPDFDYVEYRLLTLSEFENEVEKEIPIFSYNNKVLRWNGENENLNKFLFEYFVDCIIPIITKEFKNPILLQMLDSQYLKVWNAEPEVRRIFENLIQSFGNNEFDQKESIFLKWIRRLFN